MRSPVLLVPALALAIVVMLAQVAGAVNALTLLTLSSVVEYKVYEKTLAIQPGTYTVDVTVPDILASHTDSIKVVLKDYAASVQLRAKDALGKVLANVTVVPLSSGYTVTLPKNTSSIELLTTQVWEGTITIYVVTPVVFNVYIPPITVQGGTGQAMASVNQTSGPAGKIFLTDDSTVFDVKFADPTPEYDGDTTVETGGAGWKAQIPVVVTAGSVSAGTYNVKVRMWFYTDNPSIQPVEVAAFTLALDVGSTAGSWEEVRDVLTAHKQTLMYVGVGILALLLLLMLVKPRKGMAGLEGNVMTLLLFLLVVVLGVSIAFLDQTHAVALGVGVGAFLVLLLLYNAGKLRLK